MAQSLTASDTLRLPNLSWLSFQPISARPWAAALSYAGLRSAARDSERRVRLVLAAGKSTVKSPNDAAPDAERQMIFICDPTTRTTITLDTANKSATVRAPRGNPPDALKPLPGLALSFCAGMIARRKRAPGTQSEDLGNRLFAATTPWGFGYAMSPVQTGIPRAPDIAKCGVPTLLARSSGKPMVGSREMERSRAMKAQCRTLSGANPILHSSKSPMTTPSSNA